MRRWETLREHHAAVRSPSELLDDVQRGPWHQKPRTEGEIGERDVRRDEVDAGRVRFGAACHSGLPTQHRRAQIGQRVEAAGGQGALGVDGARVGGHGARDFDGKWSVVEVGEEILDHRRETAEEQAGRLAGDGVAHLDQQHVGVRERVGDADEVGSCAVIDVVE